MAHIVFRIEFSKARAGYDVSMASAAGEVLQPFVPPFAAEELERLARELTRGPAREGGDSDAVARAKLAGGQLFDALFQGEALAALKSTLDRAADAADGGVRLTLHFRDAPELAALPWELLYRAATDTFFALSGMTPVVRHVELPDPPRAFPLAAPLAVLALVSSPKDAPELDVAREKDKLLEALRGSARGDLLEAGAVAVDWIEEATLPALQAALRRRDYHVLHFIGHGEARGDEGVLLLSDAEGRGVRVSGSELGTLLHDERSLRLAVLNACEGAKAPTSDRFSAVGLALVRHGLPAVVAMQFAIGDEAAIVFARELYAALADGTSLEVALAEARRAIYARRLAAEWATPVLYSRLTSGEIFSMGEPVVSSPPVSEGSAGARRLVVAGGVGLLLAGLVAIYLLVTSAVVAPDAPDAGAPPPSAPPPELVVVHVYDPQRIERQELEVAPGVWTQAQAEALLGVASVAFGRLPDETTGYDVRLRIDNATDDVVRLTLDKRFFALEDGQGRSADLLYFCCEIREAILSRGATREVQLVFRSRPEWGGKSGISQAFLRVQGFIPIVRAVWRIALPVTAQ
jgi:hypothetical protein